MSTQTPGRTPQSQPLRPPPIDRPASPAVYRKAVWEHQMRSWKPYIWSALSEAVGTPVLYLLALGLGMGSLVDQRNPASLGGVPYLHFIAPALLCAAAFQMAMGEATHATFGWFEWQKTIWGITATPITGRQACQARIMFLATRLVLSSALFYLALVAFGAAGGPAGLLMIPVAMLTALSTAVWMLGVSATLRGGEHASQVFNMVFRFGVIPISLLSASFFPLSGLPWTVRWLALLSPLWHGNELARGAAIGGLAGWQAVVHVVVLVALLAGGYWFATRQFARRVTQ